MPRSNAHHSPLVVSAVMAESRRVQLTTLSRDAPSSCDKPAAKCRSGVLQGKESGPDRPADTDTLRLVLTLFEPDERSFPEFSYSQLADNKDTHLFDDEAQLSRFEEEEKRANDEVAALSRKLEEKYGGKRKRKKDRIQDLIDIGYGYDEEDSFIDNSEAYDEFVPASITTKFGGFYVNSGVLQFRQASETEDLTVEEETLEPSKKRKVSGRQDKPKKKCCREGAEVRSNVDPQSSTLSETGKDDEMKKKKKKKAAGTLSVTSMLKKFQREKEKERQKMEKANQKPAAIMGAVTIPVCPADAAGGGGTGLTDPLLSLIGSTNDHALIQAANTEDFDIDLDSLLDASEGTLSPKMAPQPGTELFRPQTVDLTQPDAAPRVQPPNTKTNLQLKPHSEQIQLQAQSSSSHQCVPLPEGLPTRLEDSVQKLTAVARTSEGESKLKFFTPEINSILLDEKWRQQFLKLRDRCMCSSETGYKAQRHGEIGCRFKNTKVSLDKQLGVDQTTSAVITGKPSLSIELQCREQGGQLRSKVYTHLSSFLPCSRDTLLKRVKKLLLTHMEEPADEEDPMQKLKEAIGRAMPEQIACFQENCQAYEQVKTSKTTEEEKDGKQKVNVGPEDNVEEKGGKRGGPKKLFKWNEEIRESLCHVLRVKMETYKKEKKGSQEMEEFLKTVLDNEVKPLWPKGWMQSRVLIRESRKMLSLFTSLPVKRARPEKKQPSIIGPPATSDGCIILQGSPTLNGLPQEVDDVFVKSSDTPNSVSLGGERKDAAVLKKVELKTGGGAAVDAGSSTPAKGDKPLVTATSAPSHSPLDLLADQALAREQPLLISQELLAAAVAKYKRSVQHWSFGVDTKSPPLPPPPPQSSPVGFPLSGVCHAVLPQLLQLRDFARNMDDGHVQVISDDDDDDVIIQ